MLLFTAGVHPKIKDLSVSGPVFLFNQQKNI